MSTMIRPSVTRAPAPHTTTLSAELAPPRVECWDLIVPGGPDGQLGLRLFRPAGPAGPLPVVVCVHDGADDLAAGLAAELNGAVLVPDGAGAATTARIEQVYAAVGWIASAGRRHGLDRTRVALAANPAGAEVADAVMLMADRRGGPVPVARVLLSARTKAALRAALAA